MQPFSLLAHTSSIEGEQLMQHIVKEQKQKARRLANLESNKGSKKFFSHPIIG